MDDIENEVKFRAIVESAQKVHSAQRFAERRVAKFLRCFCQNRKIRKILARAGT